MQHIVDFVNSYLADTIIDRSNVLNVQAGLNEEMKVDDWMSLILSNEECIVMKTNNGTFADEGYVLTKDNVLKGIGNHGIGRASSNEELVAEGIVDLDHGSRFEGLVLTESGIPFGFGKLYDDDGLLVYEGIVINWKRFGYGVSYHNNGSVEYEGYWCDDKRCGRGKLYDRCGEFVKECEWYKGRESDAEYTGDGSRPIHIGTKHVKLSDNCVMRICDFSWLFKLESIEIGNNCFESVQSFSIDGFNTLKSLKIGDNSFTKLDNVLWTSITYEEIVEMCDRSKSFQIRNCKSLESIEIGEYSFSDFAGDFELKNLNSLQSVRIGQVGSRSGNFYFSSFVIRGNKAY